MSRGGDDVRGIAYLIIFGGFFFWKGFRDLRLQRKMAGLATSRARSLAMGLVELAGIAKSPDAPLQDPVYSQPCCYFHLKVEQYRRSGKSGSWVTIHEESSDNKPFLCRDSTGEVVILPKKPEVYFRKKLEFTNSMFGSRDAAASAYLNARWSSWSSLRLTLDVLREGEPIYVMGCAMTGSSTISSSQGPTPTKSDSDVAREMKQDPKFMGELDTNKDGQIDAMEWDVGLKKYRAFLEAKRLQALKPQAPVKPLVFQGMVTRTDEHELIFATDEKYLSNKLGPMAYLKIIGGCAALIGGFAWLVSLYH